MKVTIIDRDTFTADNVGLLPEIGQLRAVKRSTNNEIKLNLVNCTEVLTQKIIEDSNTEFYKFDTDPNFLCLDPKDAHTSRFTKSEDDDIEVV